MKKYIIPFALTIGAIALYLTSKAQKQTKNSSSVTNQPFSILRTTTTTTTTKTISDSGSQSSGNNQGSTTNQDVVDTSQIYDYWQQRGEFIYLRKGGKTATGNYSVGFLKDGRTVYTNYQNEGTPEETMLYSLSPDYVLTY
ncbi:hypothetical protein [Flectobacillus rivi]|uniref:Uncharacterized protein n=1 Tax=Flectobacillus rivi TaxID=2984209 RepID=A0ABT6Z1P6_9BACT|nr:hypothetical protein [Flectobacillus rivi]MDI9874960.1 hypothetical protein [Flectobacillus rivi]